MRAPTLRYIIIFIFIISLIPLVVLPIINKQKDIQTNISKYEEILSAIDEQTERETDTLYDKYKQSVLGTYDSKIDNEEYIQNVLKDVDDVVDSFDLSSYKYIEPDTNLPIIDLSKSNVFKYGLGDKEIEVIYEKPEGYTKDLQYIFMYTALHYENSKVCNVQIREVGDFKGTLSLHVYNDNNVQYPTMIVGSERIASYRDKKSVYFLINDQLFEYEVLDSGGNESELRSTLDIDMYLKDGSEYLLSYWENPILVGTIKTLWIIDHNNREIIRDYSVLDLEK